MAEKARLQVKTTLDPEKWSDVGSGAVGVPIPVELETGDIQIGAVELKDATTDNRATVNATGHLLVDGSGATQPVTGTVTTGVDSVMDSKWHLNAIDDATTASVTYFCMETIDPASWYIKKFDESGAFLVITHATIVNNPTVANYNSAYAARTTLTYGVYDTAF